jgi:hypothetical protein
MRTRQKLTAKYNCQACHTVDKKLVGPAFRDIAKKYAGDATAVDKLEGKVKNGSTGYRHGLQHSQGPKLPPGDTIPVRSNSEIASGAAPSRRGYLCKDLYDYSKPV